MAKKKSGVEIMAPNGGTSLVATAEMGIGSVADPQAAVKEALSRGTRILPKIHTLREAGEYIDGHLEGEGAPVEIIEADGNVIPKKTWVFNIGGRMRLALKGNYQLDHELPALVDSRVRVTFLGEQNTRRGFRVHDYLIEQYEDAEVVGQHNPESDEIAF
jgi:hypothetical protein